MACAVEDAHIAATAALGRDAVDVLEGVAEAVHGRDAVGGRAVERAQHSAGHGADVAVGVGDDGVVDARALAVGRLVEEVYFAHVVALPDVRVGERAAVC